VDEFATELERARTLPAYDAFNALWTALVRLSNRENAPSEHKRLLDLVGRLSLQKVQQILESPAVHFLASLDPPLETVQTSPHEELRADEVARAFDIIKRSSFCDPQVALKALGEVLKIIRNKREHGFKSADPETRDGKILRAGRDILEMLCVELLPVISAV